MAPLLLCESADWQCQPAEGDNVSALQFPVGATLGDVTNPSRVDMIVAVQVVSYDYCLILKNERNRVRGLVAASIAGHTRAEIDYTEGIGALAEELLKNFGSVWPGYVREIEIREITFRAH